MGVQSRGPLFGRRRGGRALAAARPVPELGLGLRSARGESDSPRAAWSALRCWGSPGLVWVLRVEGRATGGSIGRLLPGHGHGFGLGRVPAAHGPHEPSDRFRSASSLPRARRGSCSSSRRCPASRSGASGAGLETLVFSSVTFWLWLDPSGLWGLALMFGLCDAKSGRAAKSADNP